MIANPSSDPKAPRKNPPPKPRRAAAPRCVPGNQPRLNLLGGNPGMCVLQPEVGAGDPGKLLQIRKGLDVELPPRLLQLLQQAEICATNSIDSAQAAAG
jgi:hypothetical protein